MHNAKIQVIPAKYSRLNFRGKKQRKCIRNYCQYNMVTINATTLKVHVPPFKIYVSAL